MLPSLLGFCLLSKRLMSQGHECDVCPMQTSSPEQSASDTWVEEDERVDLAREFNLGNSPQETMLEPPFMSSSEQKATPTSSCSGWLLPCKPHVCFCVRACVCVCVCVHVCVLSSLGGCFRCSPCHSLRRGFLAACVSHHACPPTLLCNTSQLFCPILGQCICYIGSVPNEIVLH